MAFLTRVVAFSDRVRLSPRRSVSQFQGLGGLIYPILIARVKCIFRWFCFLNTVILCVDDAWYSLFTNIAIYICFLFQGKAHLFLQLGKAR